MTWRQAHLYYEALLAVVADVERTADGTLPWRPEFAEVFGDPAGLVLALRRRWQLMVQAQVEVPYDPSGQPSAALRTLAEHNRGMLAVLRRHGQEPYLTGPHAVVLGAVPATSAQPSTTTSGEVAPSAAGRGTWPA
jgi:hypothetical protein